MEESHNISAPPAGEVAARKAYTWAQCDRCSKWRQISKQLAESLGNDTSWFCEHNPDPQFASCSQPQELSDDEIDKQLAGSEEDEPLLLAKKIRRPQVWQIIRENIYTHRKPKVQHEDEVMVCHCELPPDGGPACGPDCLNRVLNMECVPGYCNCGVRCSNQHFSKRQYVKLEKRRAGAKGFGLFSTEDLKAGQFIIEYIGEVLEEEEYLRRKEYYQESGQRHYYFMNIGNGEVIDAARKGALGRFINHSCRPNCETQKWMVRGELAIGLFASEDIPAGVELTFDYNFERYGDKPMRCLCGAKSCRGYIGGTGEAVMADEDMEDPEDASEDPEPIAISSAEAADPTLVAVLESEVGLAPEYWDAAVWQRLHQLAAKKGLEADWVRGFQERENSNSSGDQGTETAISLSRWRADGGTAQSALSKVRAQQKQKQGDQEPGGAGMKEALLVPPRKRFGVRTGLVEDADRKPKVGMPARRQKAGSKPWVMKGKKRSEVDRRLDILVGPSGKLKDGATSAVVGMLRLFNLCDVAPSVAQAEPSRREREREREPRACSPALAQSTQAADRRPADGDAAQDRRASPAVSPRVTPRRSASPSAGASHSSREHVSDPGKADANGTAEDKAEESSRRVDSKDDMPAGKKESEEARPKRSRSRSREPVSRYDRRDEPSAGDRDQAPVKAELTGRQRARMADLSLLLDVILKTQSASAKQAICKNGILHQLQVVHMRCVGPQYGVILKKMLRCVDHLPLTPNDIHTASSAHGSFCDVLHQLCKHSDLEVKGRAKALLDKHPLAKCSAEVQAAADAAQRARRAQGGRKRFGSRYGSGSWADANGRTPRPHATPFHDGGRSPAPWGRSMRTPQVGAYEVPATPVYHHSGMSMPAVHMHNPSMTPAAHCAPHGIGGPHATPSQAFGGASRQRPLSRLHNGNGPSMLSPAPAWATPARRADYSLASPGLVLPPGLGSAGAQATPRLPGPPPLLESANGVHVNGHSAPNGPSAGQPHMPPPRFDDQPRSSRVSRWEPEAEPGEMERQGRRATKWDSRDADTSFDAYHLESQRELGMYPPPPAAQSPVYYPGSVRIPNGEYPPTSMRILSGEYPLGSMRVAPGEDVPGLGMATPARMGGLDVGAPVLAWPGSASWKDADGLSAALQRKRDSELADIFAAPAVAPPASWEDSWDDPGLRFQEWLRDCVARAVRGHCVPGKPTSLGREESVQVYLKAVTVVLDNERKAYAERKRQRAHKALDRRKLEGRIHDYVRDTARSMLEKRSTI